MTETIGIRITGDARGFTGAVDNAKRALDGLAGAGRTAATTTRDVAEATRAETTAATAADAALRRQAEAARTAAAEAARQAAGLRTATAELGRQAAASRAAAAGSQAEAAAIRVATAELGRQAAASRAAALRTGEQTAATRAATAELQRQAAALQLTERQQQSAAVASQRLTGGLASVRGALATLGVGFGVAELGRLADGYTNLRSQLRLVTADAGDLAAREAELFDVAARTRTGIESTAQLYARLTRSTAQLGVTQAEVLTVTEAIAQSFQISGASSEEMRGAIVQLGQALASGVLRGDEFNSVMEQAPRLGDAVAASLGVTTGELRKLAAEGRITAAEVFGALLEAAPKLAEEFQKVEPTIAGALTVVRNEMLRWIGTTDQAAGVSRNLTAGLGALAANLDGVATGAVVAGGAFAAWRVAAIVSGATVAIRGATGAMAIFNVVVAANPIGLVAAALGTAAAAYLLLAGNTDEATEASRRYAGMTREQIRADLDAAEAALVLARAKAEPRLAKLAGADPAEIARRANAAGIRPPGAAPVSVDDVLASPGLSELEDRVAGLRQALETAGEAGETAGRRGAAGAAAAEDAFTKAVDAVEKEIAALETASLAAALHQDEAERLRLETELLNAAKESGRTIDAATLGTVRELADQYVALRARLREVEAAATAARAQQEAFADIEANLFGGGAAQHARDLDDVNDKLEAHIAGLEEQVRLAGLSEEARARELALAQAQAVAEGRLTAAQAARVVAATEALAQQDRQRAAAEDAAREWQRIWDNAADGVQRSIADAFRDALDGSLRTTEDFAEAFKSVMLNAAAEIAAAMVFQPVVASVLGGGGGGGLFGGGDGSGGVPAGLLNRGVALLGDQIGLPTSGINQNFLSAAGRADVVNWGLRNGLSVGQGSALASGIGTVANAGAGFAGSFLGDRLSGGGANGRYAGIGGTIGGVIGSAFGPVGTFVGSTIGSTAGGFLGPGPSVGPNAAARITLGRDGTFVLGESGADNGGQSLLGQAEQAAAAAAEQLNRIATRLGRTFDAAALHEIDDPGLAVQFGDQFARGPEELVRDVLESGALGELTDRQLADALAGLDPLHRELAALTGALDAADLGAAIRDQETALREAERTVADAARQARDDLAAELRSADGVVAAHRDTADALREAADDFRAAAATLAGGVDQLLLSADSPLAPAARLAEAERQFAAARAAGDADRAVAAGGALAAETAGFFGTATARGVAGFDAVVAGLREMEAEAARQADAQTRLAAGADAGAAAAEARAGLLRAQLDALDATARISADQLAAAEATASAAAAGIALLTDQQAALSGIEAALKAESPDAAILREQLSALERLGAGQGTVATALRDYLTGLTVAAAEAAKAPVVSIAAGAAAGSQADAFQAWVDEVARMRLQGFAAGGVTPAGRMVEVHSGELLYTGPSTRVFNAAETAEILDGGGSAETVRTLRQGFGATVDALGAVVARLERSERELAAVRAELRQDRVARAGGVA